MWKRREASKTSGITADPRHVTVDWSFVPDVGRRADMLHRVKKESSHRLRLNPPRIEAMISSLSEARVGGGVGMRNAFPPFALTRYGAGRRLLGLRDTHVNDIHLAAHKLIDSKPDELNIAY